MTESLGTPIPDKCSNCPRLLWYVQAFETKLAKDDQAFHEHAAELMEVDSYAPDFAGQLLESSVNILHGKLQRQDAENDKWRDNVNARHSEAAAYCPGSSYDVTRQAARCMIQYGKAEAS